ncbi:M43 family zinc metalloprotease [Fluviicola sp.]|jgi:PKD repeat protein|uniref:M43 family zinc metalloprotease n=1 Tax=Fluviicola sp. TaxID=1917219 RepID=UPI002835D771|nr:M43 family zinc metalloprotease [Fluviicola sp.]MDR0803408.1 PKD domain-containing protein [Fluviicola sp.]
MRKLTVLFMTLLCGFISFAQVTQSKPQKTETAPEVEKCSQHTHMQEMKLKDPERYATVFRGETNVPQAKVKTPVTEKATGIEYTVPVVFHILHNNGTENISDAQIADALAILNRDYRRLNADANNVYTTFQGMPTDAEINFVFATVAPNGACFSGITRTVSTQTSNGSDGQAQVNAIIAGNNVYQGVWPHNRYLNVYVCKDLGGAAGYTFLPNGNSTASATNMYYNGIFLLHNYCGSIGTSSVTTSRALTHEVGHWFNLSHVWGDDNNPGVACGDDYVSDTPITKGFTSCPTSANAKICNPSIVENYENYMDYSYCSKMFTPGQVTRMRNAIVSTTGGRSNVWTTSNLNLVGGGPGTSLCVLDFSATQATMCEGTTVTYSANTSSGIATYFWSFPGGTPSSSTSVSPTVTYATVGTYNASLTVTASSNGNTYSKSKTGYITVNSVTTVNLPISEGFVSTTFPPAGWTILNTNNSTTWARSTAAGKAPTTGNSVKFDNYNVNDATDDELRLPKLDITAYSSAQLTFDVAYAPYNAAYYDGLEVLVSTNCGGTFTSVYSKSYTTLATANATISAFTPTTSQWRSETIDLTPYVGNSSVWIAFRNLSGNGNNLYLDNINITGVSGTPAPTASFTSTGTSVCAGQSVTYTSTSTGSPTSYSWSFPGGTPSSSASASQAVTYSTAGTYSVSLTVTNAGGSGVANQTNLVTVNPNPTVSFGSLPLVCVYDSPIILTQGSPSGGTYSGTGVSGGQFNPSVLGIGSTVITYNYTNPNGCSGSAQTTATVDGCASVGENELNFISVYPNPFSGVLTVSSGDINLSGIQVFNALGQVVYELNGIQTVKQDLNLSTMAKGIYTLRILTEAGIKHVPVILEK